MWFRLLQTKMTAAVRPTAVPQQIRTLMPKPGKTHHGAAARFWTVGGTEQKGIIYRGRAGASHLNIKKSSSRLRRLSRPATVSRSQLSAIKRLIRY